MNQSPINSLIQLTYLTHPTPQLWSIFWQDADIHHKGCPPAERTYKSVDSLRLLQAQQLYG